MGRQSGDRKRSRNDQAAKRADTPDKDEESNAEPCRRAEVSTARWSGKREPVRCAGTVFFPLDQEWGRTTSDVTPPAQEGLGRLATWVPFAKAAHLVEGLLGVRVRASTTRRASEEAGRRRGEPWNEQARDRWEKQPPALVGAARTVCSADGAMVP